MRFGGFQPFTLSDFPGRTAAIAFTQGCNFRCPFCHNGALIPMMVPENELIPESTVLDHLRKRKGRLDGLVVTGGEPTLQRALPVFLGKVKSLGFQTKLDTNGSRPTLLKSLIEEGLVDFVAMDIKAPIAKYDLLTGTEGHHQAIEESMAIIRWSGVEHVFRTTHVPALLNPTDLHAIKNMLPVESPYVVQTFNPKNTFDTTLRVTADTA